MDIMDKLLPTLLFRKPELDGSLRHLLQASAIYVAVAFLMIASFGQPGALPSGSMMSVIQANPFWREDGLVEWATVVFDLAAGLLFAVALWRGYGAGFFPKWRNGFFLLALAAFLIVVAGEEISWGQRIFGFGTPERLATLNRQHEFNLHNIAYIHRWKDDIGAVIILMWGVVLPIAVLLSTRLAALRKRFWIPLPPLTFAPFFAAALGTRLVFKPLYGNVGVEGLEMLFGLAMLIVAWHALHRVEELFD